MKNPVVIRKPTPNGGNRSELWLFGDGGRLAQNKDTATHFKLLEVNDSDEIVCETDGTIERKDGQQ